MANFVRVLLVRQPVWLVTRSVAPIDLGHVWPILFFFQRVDVPPFSAEETRAFLAAVEYEGDRDDLLAAALRLHRIAAGHPGTLAALIAELRCRTYDLQSTEGLRLLALHARITNVESRLKAELPQRAANELVRGARASRRTHDSGETPETARETLALPGPARIATSR